MELFWILSDITIVGQCGLTSIDYVNGNAEYSMLIGPEHQGNGYATMAMKELLRVAFDVLRLHLVWGEIYKFNKKGKEVAIRSGMKVDGTLRDRYYRNGKYVDVVHVSMTEYEWAKLNY